ncbi:choloylglycine hydrolase [Planctomycetia bacterium]|jgi:choloylglycine hydrolase|nr:choloylglycine hydrolase [Planctomycetia bacterium]
MPRQFLVAAAVLSALATAAQACTRCVYLGPNDTVMVARSMDWVEDPGSEVWVFPRGMKRNGTAGPGSLEWTSRYGSAVVSFYGIASVDGMNEKGLVANTLYLVESDYGKRVAGRPTMSIACWTQYVLDSFATVKEAVAALEKEPFTVVAPILPNGEPGVGHMAISDPTGDSAILEYVKGKLVVHHGRQFQVMTNSPTFDQQLSLNAYWKEIGGLTMLPGTNRAADRFARASFYVTNLPQTADPKRAVAQIFSVIRGVSVPLGFTVPDKPNIASTIWRTVYDHKDRVMYFDSATSPTVFWLPLESLSFDAGAPVKRLALKAGETYSGDASETLKPAEPFAFLQAKPD